MTQPMAHPMLGQLCEERYGRLVALAAMLLGTSQGAEDLVHEALIAVFSRQRRFPNVYAAEGYVRRAIASRFLDQSRRGANERILLRRSAAQLERAAWNPEPSEPHLESLLRQLPPRVRACVVLRFLDDMSVLDTASALGLSEGSVKRYVSDGLATLNAALGTTATLVETRSAAVESRRVSHD